MSRRREQADQGMDEVDGDPGNIGMFQARDHKPGYEPGNMKNQERMESFHDSGLGSLSSIGSDCLSGPEGMIARLSLADRIHAKQNDEGYCAPSLSALEEEDFQKETPVVQPVESSQEIVDESKLAEALYMQDKDGDTKLHVAIAKLSPMAVAIINVAPTVDHLNIYNKMVLTPLHMAVITNQPLIVRKLVAMGARLEVRDAEGNTPLHIACREGYLEVVEALTRPLTGPELMGAEIFPTQQIPQDLELKNYEGYTCMHLCCQNQVQCNTIVYLITHLNADVNARDGLSGRTVLHHAADVGDTNTVHFLINLCRADVNARAYSGCTPLRIAIGRGHWRVTEILRQAGAYEPNAETSSESEYSTDDEMIDDFTIGGRPVSTLSS